MNAPVGSWVTGERPRSAPRHRAWSAVGAGLFAASLLVGFGPGPSMAADPVYTRPVDVIFVIDRSGSMDEITPNPADPIVPGVNNTRLGWANDAANDLVTALEANGGVGGPTGLHHVGLVTYGGGSSTLNLALGAATGPEVHAAIDVWDGFAGDGGTPIDSGMAAAVAAMTAGRRDTVDGVAVLQVVIMLSDGRPNPEPGARPTPDEIAAYLAAADQAYSIGIGPTGTGDPGSEPDLALMQSLANPASAYQHLVDAASLPSLFAGVAEQILVANVEIQASANPAGPVDPGTPVTYDITVWNDAEDTPLTSVAVTADGCAVVSGPVMAGGNQDGLLEMGESWAYSCTKNLDVATDTQACAATTFIGGGTDSACVTVSVAIVPPTPTPTPPDPAPATPAPTPTPAAPGPASPAPSPTPAPAALAPSTTPMPSEQPELVSPSPTPRPDVAMIPPPPAAPPAPPSDEGPVAQPESPDVVGGVLAVALQQVSTVVKPEAAVAVASAFSFPLALMAAVVFFLVGQGRLDARDPKLRSAPRTPQETVLSFRNEEEL
jgi:hypothetical protein